jgi:RNA polymerase sigma-70 factor, ECF subfamily
MGNSGSFDAFYAARAPKLVRNIYLRTGDATRAEDCVQEAFVRAWRRWDRLESDDPVGWVTAVAWRLAIRDWRRTLREAAARVGLDARPREHIRPPDELIHLHHALGKLTPAQRDVLVLHYLDDMPVRDVSMLLRMPEGTVKSHLSRGRVALREALALGGATT